MKVLGGRAKVAERFRISREAVRLWLVNGIPPDWALDVEDATRGSEFPVSALEILQHAQQRRAAA